MKVFLDKNECVVQRGAARQKGFPFFKKGITVASSYSLSFAMTHSSLCTFFSRKKWVQVSAFEVTSSKNSVKNSPGSIEGAAAAAGPLLLQLLKDF